MHVTPFPVIDPVHVLLVLLAGLGVIVVLSAVVLACVRLREVVRRGRATRGRSADSRRAPTGEAV